MNKNRSLNPFILIPVLLVLSCLPITSQECRISVPGVVVSHVPAGTGLYIGSPSICILPGGSYLAAHDFFGPSSTEFTEGKTAVYSSSDKGRTWNREAEIHGQFWSGLFVSGRSLFIMGTSRHHGDLVIRRSDDGGKTWSEPADSLSGILLKGEYHTAPVPVIFYQGRIWRAVENASSDTDAWGKRYSAMVVSAPADADLLKASSWIASNCLKYDSLYLDGNFGGWLEGNAVVDKEGKVVDFLRVATSEPGRDMAAIVRISNDGKKAEFNQESGFLDFEGGARKFTIRYDEKTKLYWTITNYVTDEFSDLPAGSVRNTLVLKSSANLLNWRVNKVLLAHPDVKTHGFQYVDWQFDGRDLVFVCRTAFDDEYGGAHNFHDANYMTFHRIRNYKKLRSESVKP